MWPAFVLLTLLDGVILHELPPVRLGFTEEGMTLPFGIIVAAFGNLFLVGVAAPWLARRLVAREQLPTAASRQIRREVLQDRVGTVLLGLGLIGVLAAGLGSREVVVSETADTEENARVVKSYVERSGNPELLRNLETANTIKLGPGYFRTCIAHDDRRSAFCLLVNTHRTPTSVRVDPSSEPNSYHSPP